ncbi:hypothetical protein LX32DRAFT_20505 [Colletotrichum zoysiae]|uniref:Uncharacterized protein n=1 Tax=Colletotrichum zoysiae TaxID=1216348 RepID=A0AAD9HCS2_9PEZI|nr:hypothetical protein LX32DRAFT_20505 [Colletotrichum zoysiae]
MRARPDRLDRPAHPGDGASTKPDTPPGCAAGEPSDPGFPSRGRKVAPVNPVCRASREGVCGYESSRTGCRAAMRQRRPHCGSNQARDNGIVPGAAVLGQARSKNHQHEHEPSQHKVHEGCWIKLNCR